ncbi:MAG: DUF3109 family protein [Bacteroidia bacterium]|nr:DUF3109 family protein [Bacteroidia bacterium]
MIIIGNTLVSEELLDYNFICNLHACKGACCIEGDLGAPVLPEEKVKIEEEYEKMKPFLTETSKLAIEKNGICETDEDNDWVTTCLPTGECNFVKRNEQGILMCGMEQAFIAGATNFRKPISCYLYPIRVTQVGEYEALNYSRWDICSAACVLGDKEKVAIYKFLKAPLILKYGEVWYAELEAVAEAYYEAKI